MPLTVMGNFIVFLAYSIYSLSGHNIVFSPLTTAFIVRKKGMECEEEEEVFIS